MKIFNSLVYLEGRKRRVGRNLIVSKKISFFCISLIEIEGKEM